MLPPSICQQTLPRISLLIWLHRPTIRHLNTFQPKLIKLLIHNFRKILEWMKMLQHSTCQPMSVTTHQTYHLIWLLKLINKQVSIYLQRLTRLWTLNFQRTLEWMRTLRHGRCQLMLHLTSHLKWLLRHMNKLLSTCQLRLTKLSIVSCQRISEWMRTLKHGKCQQT